MRRFWVLSFLVIVVMGGLVYLSLISYSGELPRSTNTNSLEIPKEGSKNELIQDTLLTLLDPYIRQEVKRYYSRILTVEPSYAPYYGTEILYLDRPNGYRTFEFVIKLKVVPYLGPHIDVGTDHITFKIDSLGNVQVKEFEHIRGSDLPAPYDKYIKH